MSERVFYIGNNWLTFEEAHALGYTLLPAQIVILYNDSGKEVRVKNDTSDNTYYDEVNQIWVSDIDSLNLFYYKGTISLFSGEKSVLYDSYSSSVAMETPDCIMHDGTIIPKSHLYYELGITDYPCKIYSAQDGQITSWYDEKSNLYWDNRPDKLEWTETPPKIEVAETQSNWTPPSLTFLDLGAEFLEYIETEPLKLSGSGNITTSYNIHMPCDGFLLIDSFVEDYELFVVTDVTGINISLYTSEDVTYVGVSYPAGTKLSLIKSEYYEDVEGSEVFYYMNDSTQVEEVFYYRTDFENHTNERIYFNESNLPETYEYYLKLGYSTKPWI